MNAIPSTGGRDAVPEKGGWSETCGSGEKLSHHRGTADRAFASQDRAITVALVRTCAENADE